MDLDIQCKTDSSDRIYHDETDQLCSQQEMIIRGRQCSYLSSTQIYGPSKNELICRDVCKLELKFEAFSCAIAAMCIIIEQVEARLYEQHLLVWANHYGWIKDKAEQMVSITKLPMDNIVANTIHCDDTNQTRDEPLYIPSLKSTAASAVLDRNMSQSSLVERGVTIVQSGQYKGESDIKHSSGKEIENSSQKLELAIWSLEGESKNVEADLKTVDEEVNIAAENSQHIEVYLDELS